MGVRTLRGKNLKVVCVKYSTLSLVVFVIIIIVLNCYACPQLELKTQLWFSPISFCAPRLIAWLAVVYLLVDAKHQRFCENCQNLYHEYTRQTKNHKPYCDYTFTILESYWRWYLMLCWYQAIPTDTRN
jgi:hypothetical protein